jgi:NAD(P)H dehydrogenase (quinone)
MTTRILITGATGKVGGAVIPLLAGQPGVEVVAAARSPDKASRLGVPVVLMDFDRKETLAPALEGVDRILMLTGYTVDMFKQSKAFVNEARRAGVKHIVHLGACGDDDTEVAHWGWQQFVERYIEWAGFTFTHLRPDIYMQNLLGYGGARAVGDGVIRHYVGGASISWVDCDDVAAVAAQCLLHPDRHAGKTYRLASDVKTYDEVAQTLTRVLGQPFSYEARPPEEFLQNVLAAGADAAYMHSAYENYALYAAGKTPEPGADFSIMAALMGRKGKTWAEFAAAHAAQFKY